MRSEKDAASHWGMVDEVPPAELVDGVSEEPEDAVSDTDPWSVLCADILESVVELVASGCAHNKTHLHVETTFPEPDWADDEVKQIIGTYRRGVVDAAWAMVELFRDG